MKNILSSWRHRSLPRVPKFGAVGVACALFVLTTGCASGPMVPLYRSFVPPPVQPRPVEQVDIAIPSDAPNVPAQYQAQHSSTAIPSIPRPSNLLFLIEQSSQEFAAGKRSLQDGHIDQARRQFDRAIEVLIQAEITQNPADRRRLEQRLDELTQAIYEYDLEEMGAGLSEEASGDSRPADEILELTFPIDPDLRVRVREQVAHASSDLPLEENDAVLSWINYFSTERGRKTLLSGLAKSGRYGDLIRKVFDEQGLPQELIHVAQLESGFNPRAVSYMSAVGMWQFVRSSGTEHGLHYTAAVDERMDPEKATYAAADYLGELYHRYGDWHLALAAYNCGPGCVDAAIRRTGYADFWELRRLHALPLATANYVPVILAMSIMAKNLDAYDLVVEYTPKIEYDSVELESATHLALVAAATDRPLNELKNLNPALLRSVAPVGYMLRVPKDTLPQLDEAFATIPPAQRTGWRLHRVEEDDTLASLSKKYKVSLAQLTVANHGELPVEGKLAAIPLSYPGDPAPKKAKVVSKKSAGKSAGKSSSKSGSKTSKPTASKSAAKSSTISKSTTPGKTVPSRISSAKTPAKPSARAGNKTVRPTSVRAGA